MRIKKKLITATLAAALIASPTAALAQEQKSWLEIFCESPATTSAEAWAQYLLC